MRPEVPSWCPGHVSAALPEGEGAERVAKQLTRLATEVADPWEHLARRVDGSKYDLEQWFEAMAFFDRWLSEAGRDSSIDHRLGYIECATQSPEALTLRTDLAVLVGDLLAIYGYDGEGSID